MVHLLRVCCTVVGLFTVSMVLGVLMGAPLLGVFLFIGLGVLMYLVPSSSSGRRS